MKSKPLVSIIVPVYNVKNYLSKCLESIINQTYADLEIIVIDDGSTDGSADICDQFEQMDKRIRVIHQANTGVATARRTAVLCSSGEYIGFVDADDKIDSEMVAFLIENIGECELITSGCHCERKNGEYFDETDLVEEGIYDTENAMEYIIANMLTYKDRYDYGVLPYLVNKMFNAEKLKSVIRDIHSVLSYAEDGEVLFQYILNCKAIRVTHKCFYYYCYRADSAMQSINKNYLCDLNGIYLALEQVFERHPKREVLIRQLQLFVTARIYAIPWYMGFPDETRTMRYIFPFSDLETGSKIILYGAGRVGLDYYRQIFRRNLVELALWTDSNWEKYENNNLPISAPENIKKCEYDYIIIAVKKREAADEIYKRLVQEGITEEKILWRIPAVL